MKRILFASALLLTGTLTFAQTPAPAALPAPVVQQHGHNPHKAAMRMSRQLGLSSDQEARLEPVLADRQQKLEAVRANTSLTDEQRRQQLKQIHQGSQTELSTILSPDQMKQLHTLHHDRKAAKSPAGV